MPQLIALFNLQHAVEPDEYEQWAKDVDIPTVKALASVDDFVVYRLDGRLGSDDPSPYRYCEVITVNDMELLAEELQSETAQAVAATFRSRFADGPLFLVGGRLA